MACNGYDKVLDLGKGDLVELSDACGTTLRVTKGTLWVTQERDKRDIVLRAGDVWTVAEFAHSRSRRVRLSTRLKAFVRSLGDVRFDRRRAPYY